MHCEMHCGLYSIVRVFLVLLLSGSYGGAEHSNQTLQNLTHLEHVTEKLPEGAIVHHGKDGTEKDGAVEYNNAPVLQSSVTDLPIQTRIQKNESETFRNYTEVVKKETVVLTNVTRGVVQTLLRNESEPNYLESNLTVTTDVTIHPLSENLGQETIQDENAKESVHLYPFSPTPLEKDTFKENGLQTLPRDPNKIMEYTNSETERHKPPVGRKGVNITQIESVATDECKECCANNTTSMQCACQCTDKKQEKLPIDGQSDGNEDIEKLFGKENPVTTVTSSMHNASQDRIKEESSHNTSIPKMEEKPFSKNIVVSENTSILSALTSTKNKPAYTRDDTSSDALSTTQISPESSYIIPVVAIILAVPLLIVLFLFLYKRGTEVWERRHYRRMDFLIDGMYND